MSLKSYVGGTLSMLPYHQRYFHALQVEEPIRVNLIHYLWPALTPLIGIGSAGKLPEHLSVATLGLSDALLACLSTLDGIGR
jgi:hypothetical protein